ncbi:shikimate kinase [Alkalicoccus urumqiensis]|uniref:Shikimate kinase n=1 Tax=Alkalicoccus urumqiensis TaxID=1548213 RepID=A0A2P6MK72_ALKUR|nr:shikimate kinase [Alkalicoccus urumqiensis]PRO66692.1 shikimate kinase [Alkalicoccus urumqiensis]
MVQPIYLTGFMGVGKTTVGRLLAEKCGRAFLDLDEEITRVEKKTIPEIFQKDGEQGFRKMELNMVRELKGRGCITATGGGIVETPEAVEEMRKNGTVVYLHAPFAVLYERISGDETRPLTAGGREALQERFDRRSSAYRKADICVDTEDKSPLQIVEEIKKRAGLA